MPTHTEEKENYNLDGGFPPHGWGEKGSPLTAESRFNKADLPHQEPTENGVKGLFPASLAATTNVVRI